MDDFKLIDRSELGRIYYAMKTEKVNDNFLSILNNGDRVYIVEEDTMYYGGNDRLLYKEGDGTEFVPSNG